MKTTITLVAFFLLTGVLFIRGSWFNREDNQKSLNIKAFEYPAEVKAIIDQKCYGCHSIQGKSADAKKGLMWDSIPEFSRAKQVARLDAIIDVLEQGTMPPKEVLEKYPEIKLLPEETLILQKWAEETADNLMK